MKIRFDAYTREIWMIHISSKKISRGLFFWVDSPISFYDYDQLFWICELGEYNRLHYILETKS